MTAQTKRLIIILLSVPGLLLIPLIGMQITNEVNWSFFDFLVMGTLLLGLGMGCELIIRKVKNSRQRLILLGVAVFLFLLIWAELAVGVFGTPFAGS